ncbi:MAG: hypothetical protein PHY16_19710 [Methylobacter sp.]|nr:hypothetical protein [Methylobacter sp.]
MYRIKTKLCETFNYTNQQLVAKGILSKFYAWLKEHPELTVSGDPYSGEMVNSGIAAKFFKFYKNNKAN